MSKRIEKFDDEEVPQIGETNDSIQFHSVKINQAKIYIIVTTLLILFVAVVISAFKISDLMQQIETLNSEIKIKRKNENMFRVILNDSVIQFNEDSHLFDRTLMGLLFEFYQEKKPKSIADLGCGKCQYVAELAKKGYSVIGFDGTPYTNDSLVHQIDLSQKVDFEPVDYIQTFEVGEHIYSDFEDNFIFNIASHAKKGIVMSWSTVGQGGFLHVNNRDSDYLIPKIEKYGFKVNKKKSQYFRSKFVNYFRKSLLVFDKI